MTREQFMTALAEIKGAALVWDGDIAWIEGAAIGVQWVDGVALVWGFGWQEEVTSPELLGAFIKKALAK